MENKNILIVDDHPPTCMGVKLLLKDIEYFNILGIHNTFSETLETLKNNDIDLVLLDHYLPDANGIEMIPEILKISEKTNIAIYSSELDLNLVLDAFKKGAKAYISKRTFGTKLITGIKSIFNEGYFIDNEVGKLMLDKLNNIIINKNTKPELSVLTKRELEILELISQGHDTRRISDELFISKKTVENHRLNIINKLHIKNSMELFIFANKNMSPINNS